MTEEFEKKTKLEKSMSNKQLELFTELFKYLCGRDVPLYTSGSYRTHYVKCNLSADEGLLYPMKSSFIFIYKRVRIIPFKDMRNIEILRMSSSSDNKTFDIVINMRGRTGPLQFTGLNRNAYEIFSQYLSEVNIKVVDPYRKEEQKMEDEDSGENDEVYQEEESGDDDMMSEDDDEDNE